MIMRDNVLRRTAVPLAVLLLGAIAVGPSACSQSIRLGEDAPLEAGVPSFTQVDADTDAGTLDAGFMSYCPSSKCPEGHTTCVGSRFSCDVDLLTDRHNCGACGAACPAPTNREYYECVDGQCVLQCDQTSSQPTLDCDGFIDNGCESNKSANDSCGACGVTCDDPAKPCVDRGAGDYGCGCKGSQTYCAGSCVDTRTNNTHCSQCFNPCPPGELPPSLHMYYGCDKSECGHLKCEKDWGNCDDDPDNGCETDLTLPDNCGFCDNQCPEGQGCRQDAAFYLARTCMCSPGLTFCSTNGDSGTCNDLSSDPNNCGGCGVTCSSVCVNGMCQMSCGATGYADCNGSESDGCEVNVTSDPSNCGGCGITCDGITGQACVQGRCVVEPCNDAVDAGGGPQ